MEDLTEDERRIVEFWYEACVEMALDIGSYPRSCEECDYREICESARRKILSEKNDF